MALWRSVVASLAVLAVSFAAEANGEDRVLLFGDTHLHTSNSFDAYLNRNNSADPDTAYRYAKGLPVIHPYHRARVRIETPLDFLVVADHAEYLGVIRTIVEDGIPREDLGLLDSVRAAYTEYWLRDVIAEDQGMQAFTSFLPKPASVVEAAATPSDRAIPGSEAIERSTWREAIEIADAHNDPGTFTTLIGWEWSSIPAGANLHRVVLTSAGAEVAGQFQPWSSMDSQYPEDLWAWLDETAARTGADFVAIPHNSNISKGYMFDEKTLRGEPFTRESAAKRLGWEPIVEITQIKGDSETHPSLSPDDPFAAFETYPHYIQNDPPPYDPGPGDYVRSALLRGLAIEERIGFNPYRFGVIGSTDSHSGLASAEEPNFWGKMARDSVPENKSSFTRGSGPTGWSMSAGGLAAVWASENSRQAIVDAFRRREVYATTGPRIRVRVEGAMRGASGSDGDSPQVTMGGRLSGARGGVPTFSVQAMQDPLGAPLDRIQVIKGWLDGAGQPQEHVFDIAWSGERVADARGRVASVGNTVDPETGEVALGIGAAELSAVFSDPDFDPSRPAFYYVRVLQIPTPRHNLYDRLALGLDPTEGEQPWWIQERAYTSPIWFDPQPTPVAKR